MANKARYWTAVLFNENMREGWQDDIGDLLQLPFAYCIHDKDTTEKEEEKRKTHTHIIIAFPNTTTYKHAFSVFEELNAPLKSAFNKIERCISIRQTYDYLIHNTETCFKKGKHLYEESERICGNSFDIGMFEQLGVADKHLMVKELGDYITENCFTNYADFYAFVSTELDMSYLDILLGYSGHFDRIIKGMYHKLQVALEKEEKEGRKNG